MKRPPVAPPRNPPPIRKERTLYFSEIPPGQVEEAARFLAGLTGLSVAPHPEQLSIDVSYDLHDHSLEELENILIDKGFHLGCALLVKLMRALYYYVEETELHNLEAPERLLKKSQNQAYIQAWERHPHGDHDDTPLEWREYK